MPLKEFSQVNKKMSNTVFHENVNSSTNRLMFHIFIEYNLVFQREKSGYASFFLHGSLCRAGVYWYQSKTFDEMQSVSIYLNLSSG